jgi:hypothetical protein
MTDLVNLHGFERDREIEPVEQLPVQTVAANTPLRAMRHQPIGFVTEISGGGAKIQITGQRLRDLAVDPDPSVAMSGQVGSQIKLEVGKHWLLANVRNLRTDGADLVVAEIDFLGEGDEHEQSGKLINFKRGITAYPIRATASFRSPVKI